MSEIDLVITPGDPESIGPEVTAKAIDRLQLRSNDSKIIIVGSRKPFRRHLNFLKKRTVEFIEPPKNYSAGRQSGWCIEKATSLVLEFPKTRALITGPISKERLQKGGYPFRGHTDFLASLTGARSVTMMLASSTFRVALVTDHCPLSRVSSQITATALTNTILNSMDFCTSLLNRRNPKIAILGLNPHAGEGGILGREEEEIIIPIIKKLNKRYPSLKLQGPFSADSFFSLEARAPADSRHDMIIAQYHDQGLIPVKLSGFGEGMNMTLGLPIIRTSVDHGTAFDIAGKNRANPASMVFAIQSAYEFLKTRSAK